MVNDDPTLGRQSAFRAPYYLPLAKDPAVDLILAVGPASAAMLATLGDLPKPTVAVGILDVELQRMPLESPAFPGSNLTYILVTHSIQRHLEAFHRIHPFAHLAVIVSETLKDRLDFEGFFQRLAAPYGAEVELAAMPVVRNLDDRWVLNAATVRKIGLDLSFETLFSARFLKADEPMGDRRFSLQEIIAEGLRTNLDLRLERVSVRVEDPAGAALAASDLS